MAGSYIRHRPCRHILDLPCLGAYPKASLPVSAKWYGHLLLLCRRKQHEILYQSHNVKMNPGNEGPCYVRPRRTSARYAKISNRGWHRLWPCYWTFRASRLHCQAGDHSRHYTRGGLVADFTVKQVLQMSRVRSPWPLVSTPTAAKHGILRPRNKLPICRTMLRVTVPHGPLWHLSSQGFHHIRHTVV